MVVGARVLRAAGGPAPRFVVLRVAVAVAHLGGAKAHRGVDRFGHFGREFAVGLDQHQMAVRAGRRGHVQVERRLALPALGFTLGVVGFFALLVDLAEAPVGLRAGRQPVLFAVLCEIRFGRLVAEGVDQGDRLSLAPFSRYAVGRLEVLRVVAALFAAAFEQRARRQAVATRGAHGRRVENGFAGPGRAGEVRPGARRRARDARRRLDFGTQVRPAMVPAAVPWPGPRGRCGHSRRHHGPDQGQWRHDARWQVRKLQLPSPHRLRRLPVRLPMRSPLPRSALPCRALGGRIAPPVRPSMSTDLTWRRRRRKLIQPGKTSSPIEPLLEIRAPINELVGLGQHDHDHLGAPSRGARTRT